MIIVIKTLNFLMGWVDKIAMIHLYSGLLLGCKNKLIKEKYRRKMAVR